MVTRSANDAAVVVSEALGGSEADFAKLMTRKARALGMTGTTYVNASGLPDDEQITTARDQAILGRAILDRFPGYYAYFSLPNYRYRGKDLHNHNGLLGHLDGVDGIKTGYTEASGYNLALSVHRSKKYVVAVVLGGTSNAERDARMRQLIEQNIPLATTLRTAPLIVESAGAGQSRYRPDGAGPDPVRSASRPGRRHHQGQLHQGQLRIGGLRRRPEALHAALRRASPSWAPAA